MEKGFVVKRKRLSILYFPFGRPSYKKSKWFGLKNRDDFCKILAWNDLKWIYAYRDILDLEYWESWEQLPGRYKWESELENDKIGNIKFSHSLIKPN